MGDRRRELFPPDRGLQARMAVALLINALLVALVVALFVGLLVQKVWIFLLVPAVLLFEGFVLSRKKGRTPLESRPVEPEDEARARDLMQRLCAIADMESPDVRVAANRVALSWTVAFPFKRPQVTVTTGMLDVLPERELSAVLAHELSHVANRDALVMTILAAPSVWVLRAVWRHFDSRLPDIGFYVLMVLGAFVIVPALVIAPLSRMVSRHRELVADRGAAVITGSPAAVTSALTRVFDDMGGRLPRDLRVTAPRDLFHFVPAAKREPGIVRWLWATHPRLRSRLRQMDEMEVNLQASRGSLVAALAAEPDID